MLTELVKEAFHDTDGHLTKAVNAASYAFNKETEIATTTPQEGQYFPLLASVYLNVVDTLMDGQKSTRETWGEVYEVHNASLIRHSRYFWRWAEGRSLFLPSL